MNLMSWLDEALAPAGLRLFRARPRTSGQVAMELLDTDGRLCAGLWESDAAMTRRIASELVERAGGDLVELLGGGHLLVQREGVDRYLPSLEVVVRQPGARLVAHRAEQRAVVRIDCRRYVTVVRSGRTGPTVAPLTQLTQADVRLPRVLEVDDDRGVVILSAVPGRTLFDCLSDPTSDDRRLAREVGRLGLALRSFHSQVPSVACLVQDRGAEAAAARRWLEAASRHGILEDRSWRPLLDRVCTGIAERPAVRAVVHRDLHDKQVLLQPDEPVGLVDLDRVGYGDPALDLANLLVHLDLRALEGVCTPERAALCAAALLEGYSPDRQLSDRLMGYAGLRRLRLAGVYSFRRAPAGLVDRMLGQMHAGPKKWLWQSWGDER